ncbi:DUF7919 family protein [Actinomadura logoneensis]
MGTHQARDSARNPAPALINHYITAHNYQPPTEFTTVVQNADVEDWATKRWNVNGHRLRSPSPGFPTAQASWTQTTPTPGRTRSPDSQPQLTAVPQKPQQPVQPTGKRSDPTWKRLSERSRPCRSDTLKNTR